MTRTEITKGGDTANQQTYTTASVTLTAGRLYVLGIHNHDNPSGETAPTAVATTGGAISFGIEESQPFNTEAANFRMLSFWSVVPGSTVTDTIVITLADNGTGCQWILLEYDGFDTSTPFGTPVKDAADSGTSISVTPGALANTDSHQLAFIGYNLISPTDTISGTGWTRIGAPTPLSSPNAALDYAENTSGTASQVTSSGGSGARGIIAVEIRAAASGGITLTVQEAAHGHATDAPGLTQANTLAIADAAHAQVADSPSLNQANTLAAQDALHAQAAESPAPTFTPLLAVADALHGHAAESPTLTLPGALQVADAAHGHTADNLTLTQASQLAVQAALHAHTADTPALTVAYLLAVADAIHAHSAENPTLAEAAILAVADALHAHFADSLTVTAPIIGAKVTLIRGMRDIRSSAGMGSIPTTAAVREVN